MENLLQVFREAIKHWYIPLIIGILLLLFGIYIFTVPLETYVALSIFFSVSFLVSGLLDIVFSIQNRTIVKGWGWYLVSGILSVFMGGYLIAYPGVSMVVLPYFVGFTLLFRASSLLGFALDLRDLKVKSWSTTAITSILGILFSFLLLANPLFSGLSLVTLTALAFVFSGVAAISLSLDLKKMKDFPDKLSADLKDRIGKLQAEINAQLGS